MTPPACQSLRSLLAAAVALLAAATPSLIASSSAVAATAGSSSKFQLLTAPEGPMWAARLAGEVRLDRKRGCTYLLVGARRHLLAWPAGTTIDAPAGDAPPVVRLANGLEVRHSSLIAGGGGWATPSVAEQRGVQRARAEARRCRLARREIVVAFGIHAVRPRRTLPLVIRDATAPLPRTRRRGRVLIDEPLGCAWLRERGSRRPALWPPGTVWRPARHEIQLPGGIRVRHGDLIEGAIDIVRPGTVPIAETTASYDVVPWRAYCLGVALIPPLQASIGGNLRVVPRVR